MIRSALVVLCAWWAGAAGARPPALTVARCCPAGRQLGAAALRLAELERARLPAACEPGAAWAPRVYAPARGDYLARLPAHWRLADAAPPDCPRLRVLPEHAAPYALLANNGSLLARGLLLPPARYCGDAAAALVCSDDAPAPAVYKCCGEVDAVDADARCLPAPERARAAADELRALATAAGEAAPGLALGWPACLEGSQYAVVSALRGARLDGNGSLELADGGALSAGTWCADAGVEAPGAHVWTCAGAAAGGGPAAHHALYGAGLAVGALFLAATLAAGFALPAAHHALHWRCQTHYVAALMLGDALLAATQLAADAVPPTLCRALAVCMHFLFLSAFFWLNTMCFNIWWTFRDFRPTSLERGQEAWRLRVYMLYAFGGPLLLAGAAAALDALRTPGLLRPRFGERRCWFYGDLEILVYFFGPVGVLLFVNLALFISTTRQLTCGLWRRDEVKSTSERAALGRVCAKLVVVMGVPWALDVVSWAAGGPAALWYATDVLNALQGLLIFCVVGCQPAALAALRRALACCAPPRPDHSTSHLPSCGESLTHTTNAPPNPAHPANPAPQKIPMETVC